MLRDLKEEVNKSVIKSMKIQWDEGKKIVQDMKVEIGPLKNIQTEGKLEMKNL